MNSKKMMLVSLVATICLSILAIVTIVLVTQFQGGGAKQAADNLQTSKQAPIEIESPEQEVAEFHAQGVRHYTDEYGTHDVYFEEDTSGNGYEGTTGPIHIKVQNVQMERFYPEEGVGRVFAEGSEEVTLVAVSLQVTNTSTDEAYFELKTVRGKADNGETATIESILSDDFDLVYEPNETREGTVYFMYSASPDKLATLAMHFSSAEDASYKAIDKGTDIKIDLY